MAVPRWRRAKRKRKRPPVPRKPVLYIEEILRWADAWKARTGAWPKRTSGRIPESSDEKWQNIDRALSIGRRGLPPGLSLARLLAQRRGVRNIQALPELKVSQILAWADAWKARTGQWPRKASARIPESHSDKWSTVDNALHVGLRGLPGGSSLPQLLAERRGVRNIMRLPHFKVSQILAWADAFYRRAGDWPVAISGSIAEAPGETWMAVDQALIKGVRGLPGGSSLARLLVEKRGKRAKRNLPKLPVELILEWADAYFQRTGHWPQVRFGPIPELPGETWHTVEEALRVGFRGLPGGSSLYRVLVAHRRIKPPRPKGLH